MIKRSEKEIVEIIRGKLPVVEEYYGKLLVFQAARSCFGSGYWINERPWINDDAWVN